MLEFAGVIKKGVFPIVWPSARIVGVQGLGHITSVPMDPDEAVSKLESFGEMFSNSLLILQAFLILIAATRFIPILVRLSRGKNAAPANE